MSNKDFSLFYFATIDRSYFLDKHNFYVAEARKRLFSQFSDSDSKLKPGRENKITMRPPVSVLTPIMTTKGLSVNRLMMKEFHIGLLSVI